MRQQVFLDYRMAKRQYPMKQDWTIIASRKVDKQIKKMPPAVKALMEALKRELQTTGRAGDGWPKVGPIWQFGKNRHIFKVHLNKKRPVYVTMFEVFKKQKEIKVLYAGTHENAPYGR
ncbi:cytotoxic translational repressor of toxin-antitoxin stability system [Pseudodesulfovibrio senegalensis]|uniref:Cytotoxic translational repressor of toxin-antitoxin stability system n=1 Tax=Pseudodesulfovibrio senegalensis TaxID=1721087 RepID=A0A6N6MZ20_9BACT|nr:cytotoxic translational repressor of toxin-antitoxin stability system [Pseudodesulfovibrio senegalensis]KAB1437320.1 cytotoxic translational repressor of toxin-antitoxin stability system [Pseudodesulfovibrio senegalensis]